MNWNHMGDHSYYGSMSSMLPTRFLSDDLINEMEKKMLQEMKAMEDRLKRHITECKREIIKEIILLIPEKTEEEIKE